MYHYQLHPKGVADGITINKFWLYAAYLMGAVHPSRCPSLALASPIKLHIIYGTVRTDIVKLEYKKKAVARPW